MAALRGVVPLAKYHSDDQNRKDEMGGACGTYVRGGRYTEGFVVENLRENATWEDLKVGGRMITILKKKDGKAWGPLI